MFFEGPYGGVGVFLCLFVPIRNPNKYTIYAWKEEVTNIDSAFDFLLPKRSTLIQV
jgi:hypothetical protein